MDSNQKATLKSAWFNQLPAKQQETYRFCIDLVNHRANKTGSKWVIGKYTASTKHALTGQVFRSLVNAAAS